jgi:peptidoglycan/xylan/chitin deacetylase (PgdA/CDA1 family)
MKDVIVLCYHAVSQRWAADLSIAPGRLEEQLGLLVSRGYRGATFTQATTAPPAKRTMAVTFDDAFLSVFDLAFPILTRLGLPGTVFVPTGLIGSGDPMVWRKMERWLDGPDELELVGMSWEQITELDRAGWEIGSHTRTHPYLTQLDDGALVTELRGSREDCEERLGKPCRSLAYPYGDFDQRVVEATSAAGYQAACTLPARLHRALPLTWPRVGIYHSDDLPRFRQKVSPAVRRIRSSPAWALVSKVDQRLTRKPVSGQTLI